MKKIVISAGPIPARLDSVKFITNRFKGGLALKTATYLAEWPNNLVTLVIWKFTDISEINKELFDGIVFVSDVFEYFKWFTDHANDYDAFVMAAAVANLTPVSPYEGKFPSHDYKPGDEFDIRFMIAPRAIDAIKRHNPRACLIGYKLFDAQTDEELIGIARHTLKDSKANIIFANTPKDAKSRKIALTQDGSVIECDFDDHMSLINRAVQQEYYMTRIEKPDAGFWHDINVREAAAMVKMFEKTFDGYGTIAVTVNGRNGVFMTTSRGHEKTPVAVFGIEGNNKKQIMFGMKAENKNIVMASDKATLNAPALKAMLSMTGQAYVVHRHAKTVAANSASYIFPGTWEEYVSVQWKTRNDYFEEPGHGYLKAFSFSEVDWNDYHEVFPDKYFIVHPDILDTVDRYLNEGKKVLELGGNRHPIGNYSYDPFVMPESAAVTYVKMEDILSQDWDLVIANNSVNYISSKELAEILGHARAFMANTFAQPPYEKVTENEYAVFDPDTKLVHHGLRLPDDQVLRHVFYGYSVSDYEKLGLEYMFYGKNSVLLKKGV